MTLAVHSICDLCEARSEEEVVKILSSFSCQRNSDIERFVREKALEFNKRGASSSYLVFDVGSGAFVGFYTLALKVASIPSDQVSRSFRKKFEYFGEYNQFTDCIDVPVVLLAQFGKNDAYSKLIDGAQLMSLVEMTVREIQRLAGGRFVVLDSVEVPSLLHFYSNLGFKKYGVRKKDKEDSSCPAFIQMFKYIHPVDYQ